VIDKWVLSADLLGTNYCSYFKILKLRNECRVKDLPTKR
jgi:hypothetical protein